MYSAQYAPALQAPPPKGPAYILGEAILRPPPCECPDCGRQFRTRGEQDIDRFVYQREISESAARQSAKEKIRNIERDRAYLKKCCANHGNTILSRWKKKSWDKREACLLAVDPALYPHQWFLPRLTYQYPHWKEAREYRSAWLFPSLSVEALKFDTSRFLGLLHNRTHYSPEQWAPYDDRQVTAGWEYGAFDVEYCGHCVIMQGPRYGELTPWERTAAHRWDIVGFPKAQLILQAQESTMSFLRGVVEQLLEGIDVEQPGASEKWRQMTSTGFKRTSDVEFWSPYVNQAFSTPPIFEVHSVVSIARGRKEAAEDHLWLLQTDSSYMRHAIRDIGAGAAVEGAQREDAYSIIAAELDHDATMYTQWQWTLEECENVQTQYNRVHDQIHPGKPLPPEYDQALGALELLLVNCLHEASQHLNAFIPQRPGFRRNWKHDHSVPGQVSYRRAIKMTIAESFEKDPLDWCMTQLQGDPGGIRRFDHAMLFAFLHEHLSNSPAIERARLDQRLYDKLSDFAAFHELLAAVRQNRPLSKNRDIDDVKRTEPRRAWRIITAASKEGKLEKKGIVGGFQTLGRLIKNFDSLPIPSGKQDLIWLERQQQSREALSSFWAKVRDHKQELLQSMNFPPEDVQASLEELSADSSPQSIAAVDAERVSILARLEKQAAAAVPSNKLLQTQWGQNGASDILAVRTNPKRTKGAKSNKHRLPETDSSEPIKETTPDDQNAPQPTPDSPQIAKKIPVKQRSLDVLTSLFPSPTNNSTRSINWDAFVLAMADVGFSARHSGGSAVSFEKVAGSDRGGVENERGDGRIVFHKPHPTPKIDNVLLHAMGRRMRKWFGWEREGFCLEGAAVPAVGEGDAESNVSGIGDCR